MHRDLCFGRIADQDGHMNGRRRRRAVYAPFCDNKRKRHGRDEVVAGGSRRCAGLGMLDVVVLLEEKGRGDSLTFNEFVWSRSCDFVR